MTTHTNEPGHRRNEVYPTLFRDKLYLKLNNRSTVISAHDILGRCVFRYKIADHEHILLGSEFPHEGVYWIKLTSFNDTNVFTIIKL
ncbi:MAG: hypothetical protein IH946_12900 [Bacteroidetes bacterium]|nr:hypothetical protein [Bacteroidota bacterium]